MIEAGQRLLRVFEAIYQTRMVDMPMVNPALSVAVLGFDNPGYGNVGILVTPWSMNLMLLAGPRDDWSTLRPGNKQLHTFPSGRYEFVVGDEPGIGRYQLCSLFSPMFEFCDQASAEATAQASLLALMDDQTEASPLDISLHGAEEKRPGSLSRRAFLRGGLPW